MQDSYPYIYKVKAETLRFVFICQVATVVGQVAGPIVYFKYIGPRSLRSDYALVQLTHIGFILTTVSTGMATTSSLIYFGKYTCAYLFLAAMLLFIIYSHSLLNMKYHTVNVMCSSHQPYFIAMFHIAHSLNATV